MRSVLGIDAAWTKSEPSGVALVIEHDAGWICKAVAPSYDAFIALAEGTVAANWAEKSYPGSVPDVPRLLEAAKRLAGVPVNLVAVDMPIALSPFSGRRLADDEVSRAFGRRKCSTHSPSADRPGQLGEELRKELAAVDYRLKTSSMLSPLRSLIEVYPHPALLSLLEREERVRYKVSKSRKYWRVESVPTRIRNLLSEFTAIYTALTQKLGSLPFILPNSQDIKHLSSLKRYEDALDALVCAWVGIEHLHGRTTPLGDETSAIWCPTDVIREPNTVGVL